MYVTTFYSFKGGVGRTLALMNSAVALAMEGRRVLVVDFDLEAPGLTSYDVCKRAMKSPGIVEFVQHYLAHNETPDVSDYITECSIDNSQNGGALFVMPAGRSDEEYGKKLSNIDWLHLYRERHGFLLMEDMKAQWESTYNFDYVFVDSRTGHTEESGICTRQLPNAVVVLFFPNEQNLVGLRKVVRDIRSKAAPGRHEITLHFITSNIPDLDDEDRILGRRLDRFKEQLDFSDMHAIHHYPSLALLNQELFVTKRPRSRLANEYRDVVEAIIQDNPADKRGAIAWLQRMASKEAAPLTSGEEDKLRGRVNRVLGAHPKDGQIATEVARVYVHMGKLTDAQALLETAVKDGYAGVELFRQRSHIHTLLGDSEAAIGDLLRILDAEGTTLSDVMIAFQALSDRDPSSLFSALNSKNFRALPPEQKFLVGNALMGKPEAIPVAETIFRILYSEDPARAYARIGLSLCFMHSKRFLDVLSLLGPRDRLFGQHVEVPDIFNFAMAEWAHTKVVPEDIFRRFLDAIEKVTAIAKDANYFQCEALAHWATGNVANANNSLKQARLKIENAATPTFSAWRYWAVPAEEFKTDLHAVEELVGGAAVRPLFMRETAKLLRT